MVKFGFIVEGDSEKIILDSPAFRNWLANNGIDFVPQIINATGNGNLLPKNIGRFTNTLRNFGATHIIILTDLDADACVTLTKNRITSQPNQTVVVCRKTLESWFLADTNAMRSLLKDPSFNYANPEAPANPFQEIRQIRMNKTGIGVSSKVTLANSLVQNHGFTIENSASHPSCSSAKYFLEKLMDLSQN